MIASNKDLTTRVEKLERGHDRAASVIEVLVEDIDRLAGEVKQMKARPPVPKRRIGFWTRTEDECCRSDSGAGPVDFRCSKLSSHPQALCPSLQVTGSGASHC
jgi:hypothetical protein